MSIIVCEFEFDKPNPQNPKYALHQVDYYAWIPADSGYPNHRLTLRKNLETGEYEVYRQFVQATLTTRKQALFILSHNDLEAQDDVAFHDKDLGAAVRFASGEYKRFHGDDMNDQICQHERPVKSFWCRGKK